MSIVAGDTGSFFIDTNGKVMCFMHSMRRIVPAFNEPHKDEPNIQDVKFTQISASPCNISQFIAVVSEEGKVYTWGSERYGLLGYGDKKRYELPLHVTRLDRYKVVQVSANTHCLALTDRGVVFGWGLNDNGQCGNANQYGTQNDIWAPRKIKQPRNIEWKSASAGEGHSLLVSKSGELYAFGSNCYGQLGNGFFDNNVHITPTAVNLNNNKCIDAAAGATQSLAVTEEGTVFAWGRDYNCELGVVVVAERVHIHPTVPESTGVVLRRRRGDRIGTSAPAVYADSIHQTGFPITDGELIDAIVYHAMYKRGYNWAWEGEIPFGELIQEVPNISRDFTLTENQRRFTLPQQVQNLSNVIKVSTFESANCAVTSNGEMFTWGTRTWRYGENGVITINKPRKKHIHGKVVNASISDQNNIALTQDGKMFQWYERQHDNMRII